MIFTHKEDKDRTNPSLQRTTRMASTSESLSYEVTSAMKFGVDQKKWKVVNSIANRYKNENRIKSKNAESIHDYVDNSVDTFNSINFDVEYVFK